MTERRLILLRRYPRASDAYLATPRAAERDHLDIYHVWSLIISASLFCQYLYTHIHTLLVQHQDFIATMFWIRNYFFLPRIRKTQGSCLWEHSHRCAPDSAWGRGSSGSRPPRRYELRTGQSLS
jgi:hypothetical protein